MTTDNIGAGHAPAYSPWTYLAATLAWTWCFWIPTSVILSRAGGFEGLQPPDALGLLLLMQLGAFGPSIIAIIFTARREGWAGVKRLLGKFLIWRVGIGWYAFVVLAPAALTLGGMLLYQLAGNSIPAPDFSMWPGMFLATLIAIPFGPLAEELGWRGFGLPALLNRTSALNASLILGFVWGIWHAPLYFAPVGTPVSGLAVTPLLIITFIVWVMGLSVLYTWMMAKTGGSVLMALLLHTGTNAAILLVVFPGLGEVAQKHIALWSVVPTWLLALWVIYRFGPRTLAGR